MGNVETSDPTLSPVPTTTLMPTAVLVVTTATEFRDAIDSLDPWDKSTLIDIGADIVISDNFDNPFRITSIKKLVITTSVNATIDLNHGAGFIIESLSEVRFDGLTIKNGLMSGVGDDAGCVDVSYSVLEVVGTTLARCVNTPYGVSHIIAPLASLCTRHMCHTHSRP